MNIDLIDTWLDGYTALWPFSGVITIEIYWHGGDHYGPITLVKYFFDLDICIVILFNNDCNNQYRIGKALTNILLSKPVEDVNKPKEVTLDEELARSYEGVYLKDKIELKRINNSWRFIRFKGNYANALYPIGNHQFCHKYRDQETPYTVTINENNKCEFFGYEKTDPAR